MIKAFKRWLAKAAYDGLQQPRDEALVNKLPDMLSDSGAIVVAFQIDNGFVLRTVDRQANPGTVRYPRFTYCADHQAIADHIVRSAMVRKLGVESAKP